MMKIHGFKEELAFSNDRTSEEFWDAIYRKAFPGICEIKTNTNLVLQRKGIDRIIIMNSGAQYLIDEKKRRKFYFDIALEYKHVFRAGKTQLGWMNKDACLHYLAYGFVESRLAYLFEWALLRRTWKTYGKEWFALAGGSVSEKEALQTGAQQRGKDGICIVPSENKQYTTLSLAIPTAILIEAIGKECLVKL